MRMRASRRDSDVEQDGGRSDLSKEPLAVRERYGKGDPKNYGDGAAEPANTF